MICWKVNMLVSWRGKAALGRGMANVRQEMALENPQFYEPRADHRLTGCHDAKPVASAQGLGSKCSGNGHARCHGLRRPLPLHQHHTAIDDERLAGDVVRLARCQKARNTR